MHKLRTNYAEITHELRNDNANYAEIMQKLHRNYAEITHKLRKDNANYAQITNNYA